MITPVTKVAALIATVCSSLLVATFPLIQVPVSAAEPAAASNAAAGVPKDPDTGDLTRPDSVSARLTARVTGKRVEDLSKRTETDRTYARPNGTWQTEGNSSPVEVKDDAGDWHLIDTTLVKTDEGIAPKYASSDLVLSDGGDKTFASMTEDGKDLQWQMPTDLPAPELNGSVATYKDVVPGGDLVVTANPTGFSHDIVLNERPADPIANPLKIDLPVALDGAQMTENTADGTLTIEKPNGTDVVSAPQPVMYGAAEDPETGDPLTTSAIDTTVTPTAGGGATLTLTPDPAFLADPNTTYPVTIDPMWTNYTTGDTYVNNRQGAGIGNGSAADLQVGTDDKGKTVRRTFIQFQNQPYWMGQHILGATFTLRNYYSVNCNGVFTNVNRITTPWSTNIGWNQQPGIDGYGSSSFGPAYGAAGCPDNWANWDVSAIVQSWANGSAANYGLRVASTNEAVNASFRKYPSADWPGGGWNPQISVNYNSYPATPAVPTAAPYGSYNSGGTTTNYVGSTTPTFTSASVSDPDGSALTTTFQVFNAGGSQVAACSQYTASGGSPTCQVPSSQALTNGQTYTVRALSGDGIDNGPASGSYTFTVTTGTPTAPTINCPNYANGSWAATAPGGTISCSITATSPSGSAPVGWVNYSVGNGDTVHQQVPLPGSANAGTVSGITVPATDGAHTITARAESVGGVQSTASDYFFGFGSQASLVRPGAGSPIVTTGRVVLSAGGPPGALATSGKKAYVRYRLAGSGQDDVTGWTTDIDTTLTTNVLGSGAVAVTGSWETKNAVGTGLDKRSPALLDLQVCIAYQAGDHCTWLASKRQVLREPHAFGDNYPTSSVSGGEVALFTGEFQAGATDASLVVGQTTLSISRTAGSFAGPAKAAANNIFGSGWIASLDGIEAGFGQTQVLDHTRSDGTLAVVDGDGSTMLFSPTREVQRRTTSDLATGDYFAVDTATAEGGTTATVDVDGGAYRFTLTEVDGTKTAFSAISAPSNTADAVFVPSSVTPTATSQKTSYTYDSAGRPTRIAVPIQDVTCPASGVLPTGCRALDISYASSTTATNLIPGDFAGQVKSISMTVGLDSTTVAQYAYNGAGQLVAMTDPRNSMTTTYSYEVDQAPNDAWPRLTQIAMPGLMPVNYVYAGDQHQLVRVTRDRPGSGNGTATIASFLYGIPITGNSGLPSMDATQVGKWGQADVPTYAAATFSADHPISTTDASSLTADDWRYAELAYTDSRGELLNSVNFGAGDWQYSSSSYDGTGHIIRSLDPAAVRAILSGDVMASVADTRTVYNAEHSASGKITMAAGAVVTDTYGPARFVLKADGSRVIARPHVHTDFDEGAPALVPGQQEYGLPTTTTSTAVDPTSLDTLETLDVTKTGYDNAVPGGDAAAGWTLRAASSTSQVMGSGQPDIVSQTRYDSLGRVVEQRSPRSGGNDAGTRKTAYYTAGANSVAPECGGKPEWAGALCKTWYLGAAADGQNLTSTLVSSYNALEEPLVTVETANGVSRTTAQTFRNDGRPASRSVSMPGSTSPPSVTFGYDATSGLPTSTTPSTGDAVSTGYDSWGRIVSYSAAAGESTATSYDDAGRVRSVTDPQGTTTYTYNGTDANGAVERRGLVTRIDYTKSGGAVAVSGAYDPDGALVRQDSPGGLSQAISYDLAGRRTGMTYSGPGAGGNSTPWLSWSRQYDALGRVRREGTPSGSALSTNGGSAVSYAREYAYDRAGRLSRAIDTTGGSCVTRNYSFDADGNRTALATTPAGPGGSCQASGGSGTTTRTGAYDYADRLTTNGYQYDPLGRTTTLPGSETPSAASGQTTTANVEYYADDAVKSITQNGKTQTYSLTADSRRLVEASGPSGSAATRVVTRHYSDASDNPAWVVTNSGSSTSTTRYLNALDGGLSLSITDGADVRDQIVDIRGSVVAQALVPASGNASGISGWYDSDEYGNPENSANVGATPTSSSGVSYGWLGGAERATTASGLVLMGTRAYNPTSGLFTSVDSIYRGNTTAYAYPQDPINSDDLTGRKRHMTCGSDCIGGGVPAVTPGVVAAAAISAAALAALTAFLAQNAQYAADHHIAIPQQPKKPDSTRYVVYEIYRASDGLTYKYGITKQVPWTNRTRKFVRQCDGDTSFSGGTYCLDREITAVPGYYVARLVEFSLLVSYATKHGGKCPEWHQTKRLCK